MQATTQKMFRFRISNTLVGALNLLTLLVGLAAMGCSAYIHAGRAHATHCQRVLVYPLLFGGAFVFSLSFLAILGSLCRVNVALCLYLLVTFFFIVGLAFFTALAVFATNERDTGKGFDEKEHRIREFSRLLQQYVINDENWRDVKSCLVDARVCQDLVVDDNYLISKQLSSTQFGCCKPPMQCGFTMKNATFWEMPSTVPAVNDSDCKTWDNRDDKLCYDCNSCKGGVLADIRNQWKHLTIYNVCVLILVTTLYVLGCYAIRNNRSDSNKHNKFKRNP